MIPSTGGQGSLIGATLGGYEVQALIGRGAMGAVYLAHDRKLNRQVALKVLLGSLARNPATVKQFHLEAQAAAPLRHPGIVRIYSAGIEGGTPYIAIEYVDGEPLDRFLRRTGPLKWQQALYIGGQAARALENAHANGIIHRDVKPSNIMLDRAGNVRLTDFGIAKIQTGEGNNPGQAQVIGTPQYMSPEQCSAQPVGPPSDLFALGVTIHEMIAGELPFRGESSMALIKAICTQAAPRLDTLLPAIPDDVARLVAFLMEKQADMRPAGAKVVCTQIQNLHQSQGGVSAVPEALTAFVREETEVQPFSMSQSGKGSRSTTRSAQRTSPSKSWADLARYAAVVLAVVAAFATVPLVSGSTRDPQMNPAPVVHPSTFTTLPRGDTSYSAVAHNLELAQFETSAYEFTNLSWIGTEHAVLVRARGLNKSLTQGADGLLVIQPNEDRILGLRAPAGSATDPGYWDTYFPPPLGVSIPVTPPGTPLHDAVIMQAYDPNENRILLISQQWSEDLPRPQILHRVPRTEWFGANRNTLGNDAASRIVVSPDGTTVCLLLRDTERGFRYIAERLVTDRPLNLVGTRRTTFGHGIIPESIQYSPDGNHIVYMRRPRPDAFQLRILVSGENDLDGRILAENITDHDVAFSPDGRRLAVAMRNDTTNTREIGIINVQTGILESWVGPGTLSPQAWHASSRHLVVADPEPTRALDSHLNPSRASLSSSSEVGPLQLWSVQLAAPYSRIQLTQFEDGLHDAYALSPGGEWLATILENRRTPSLLFMNWSDIGLGAAL